MFVTCSIDKDDQMSSLVEGAPEHCPKAQHQTCCAAMQGAGAAGCTGRREHQAAAAGRGVQGGQEHGPDQPGQRAAQLPERAAQCVCTPWGCGCPGHGRCLCQALHPAHELLGHRQEGCAHSAFAWRGTARPSCCRGCGWQWGLAAADLLMRGQQERALGRHPGPGAPPAGPGLWGLVTS